MKEKKIKNSYIEKNIYKGLIFYLKKTYNKIFLIIEEIVKYKLGKKCKKMIKKRIKEIKLQKIIKKRIKLC